MWFARITVLITLLCTHLGLHATEAPDIAAAASLRPALDTILARYAEATGQRFNVTYDATGTLMQKLREGFPFQILLLADEDAIHELESKGLTAEDGLTFSAGRLVLFATEDSPIDPDLGIEGLHRSVAAKTISHFAIADPETAPYGRAAKEVLEFSALWDKIRSMLVLAPNSQVALELVESGRAQGAIIPYALALDAQTEDTRDKFQLLPTEWHTPIRHGMALMKGAVEPARLFYQFLKGPEAREILQQWGLALAQPAPLE